MRFLQRHIFLTVIVFIALLVGTGYVSYNYGVSDSYLSNYNTAYDKGYKAGTDYGYNTGYSNAVTIIGAQAQNGQAVTSSGSAVKQADSSEKSEAVYYASSKSNVFHKAGCRYVKQINSGNLISFSSRDKAVSSGYRPCKVCNP